MRSWTGLSKRVSPAWKTGCFELVWCNAQSSWVLHDRFLSCQFWSECFWLVCVWSNALVHMPLVSLIFCSVVLFSKSALISWAWDPNTWLHLSYHSIPEWPSLHANPGGFPLWVVPRINSLTHSPIVPVSWFGLMEMVRLVSGQMLVQVCFTSPFSSEFVVVRLLWEFAPQN